jgi:hypothetical protein
LIGRLGGYVYLQVGECRQSHAAKWLFYMHLDKDHNLIVKVGKSKHPSIQEGGLKKFQNYVTLNVHILDDAYTMQRCNEQKAIDCANNKIIAKFHNL